MALGHLGGIPAASATMIGDTPFDAQAARRAGATAWGTLTGGHPRSSLIDAGCSVVVPAVEDLRRYTRRGAPGVSAPAPQEVAAPPAAGCTSEAIVLVSR